MSELLEVAATWYGLPLGVLVCGVTFGFLPGFVLRQIVRLWPKDHPRRDELIAELYALGHFRRVLFVFEQLETGLAEGLPTRIQAARAARSPTNDVKVLSVALQVALVMLSLTAAVTVAYAAGMDPLYGVAPLVLILIIIVGYRFGRDEGDKSNEKRGRGE